MRKFWYVVFALSLINFGITFILAGVREVTAHQLLIDTGTWMAIAGIAILVWIATKNGNGSGNHNGGR